MPVNTESVLYPMGMMVEQSGMGLTLAGAGLTLAGQSGGKIKFGKGTRRKLGKTLNRGVRTGLELVETFGTPEMQMRAQQGQQAVDIINRKQTNEQQSGGRLGKGTLKKLGKAAKTGFNIGTDLAEEFGNDDTKMRAEQAKTAVKIVNKRSKQKKDPAGNLRKQVKSKK